MCFKFHGPNYWHVVIAVCPMIILGPWEGDQREAPAHDWAKSSPWWWAWWGETRGGAQDRGGTVNMLFIYLYKYVNTVIYVFEWVSVSLCWQWIEHLSMFSILLLNQLCDLDGEWRRRSIWFISFDSFSCHLKTNFISWCVSWIDFLTVTK